MGQYYNLQSQTNTNSKKEALFLILRSVLLRGVKHNLGVITNVYDKKKHNEF